MQYVRTPSAQPAAASRLTVMLGVPLLAAALNGLLVVFAEVVVAVLLVAAPKQFYRWCAIGMICGLISRPRVGVVQC